MSTTPLKTQTQPENRQEENIEKRISGQVDYRVIFLFFFFSVFSTIPSVFHPTLITGVGKESLLKEVK